MNRFVFFCFSGVKTIEIDSAVDHTIDRPDGKYEGTLLNAFRYRF